MAKSSTMKKGVHVSGALPPLRSGEITPVTGQGYPNKVANTQTVRTRGTKNTTRGNSSSTKLG